MYEIIDSLKRHKNIERFINEVNLSDTSSKHSFTIYGQEIIELVEENDLDSALYEELLIQLFLNSKDKVDMYTKRIQEFKTTDKENQIYTVSIVAHTIFQCEFLGKYQSLGLGRLLEQHLNKDQLKHYKELVFEEHLSVVKPCISFDKLLLDYPDNFDCAYSSSLHFYLDNLPKAYFGREMTDVILNLVREDLKNRKFKFKGQLHTFTELKFEYSNEPSLLLKIEDKYIEIEKIKWLA